MKTIINFSLIAIFLILGVWYTWDQGYLYPRFEETREFWHHSAVIVEKHTGATYKPFMDPFLSFVSTFRTDNRTPDTVYVDTILYVDGGIYEGADFINGLLHVNGSTKSITVAKFHTYLGRTVEPVSTVPDSVSVVKQQDKEYSYYGAAEASCLSYGRSNSNDIFFDHRYKTSGPSYASFSILPILGIALFLYGNAKKRNEEE